MSHEPGKINPFAEAAAVNAAAEALKRLEWEKELKLRESHVEACLRIMQSGVLPRLVLAAEAMLEWGNTADVTGVARTETYSGTTHLRVKIIVNAGTNNQGRLEFIASPKSMVIAAEAERGHEKRRWQKIALTSDGISGQCDEIIRQFLTWGWVKTE
jgi:hypothetical protein